MIVTCQYHCGECHSHFASLKAFETHRAGDHAKGTRHCLDPFDIAKLAEKTDEGECRIYEAVRRGVIVWADREDLRRGRAFSAGYRIARRDLPQRGRLVRHGEAA